MCSNVSVFGTSQSHLCVDEKADGNTDIRDATNTTKGGLLLKLSFVLAAADSVLDREVRLSTLL